MIARNPDIIDFIVEVCTETAEDGQTVVSIDALGNCLGYDLEDLAYEVAVDTKGALRCLDCGLYASLEATVDILLHVKAKKVRPAVRRHFKAWKKDMKEGV